ncbi:MAG: type II toxin-antitoxin system RelE/ParE family toxin [Bacteroidota bacterium]
MSNRFLDDGNLVILLHGFTKKTQKLPRRQIEKAIQLRRAYYETKASQNH